MVTKRAFSMAWFSKPDAGLIQLALVMLINFTDKK